MSVTILAILFLITVVAVALFGFKAVIRQGKPPEDVNKERCSLCRETFARTMLVERQIGDFKMYYFCPSCINALHRDLISKN